MPAEELICELRTTRALSGAGVDRREMEFQCIGVLLVAFYFIENSRANPNAAAAARPPVNVVCNALRTGGMPATRPLMKPKNASAVTVMSTDQVSAE